MPQTAVYFYQETEADVPVWDWLMELKRKNRKGAIACIAKMRSLGILGYELRRPAADYLRDGVYELRVKAGRVNYRILYFFSGQNVALLAHGLAKEGKVPPIDIERAVVRKKRYEKNPNHHRASLSVPQDESDL